MNDPVREQLKKVADELYQAGISEVKFWMNERDKALKMEMLRIATDCYKALNSTNTIDEIFN